MKKRMQTRMHNIQRKKYNALFLVQRQCKCLTIAKRGSVFSRKVTVSNTSTLVRLREFVTEKRESSRKQSKIDFYFSRSSVANDS